MKIIKFRTEAIVVFIALMCISMVIGRVLSGTVTINDESMTTTDSNLEVNYAGGWIRLDNATIADQSLNSTVFNQWDLAYSNRGDPFFNASVGADITDAMMISWNTSSGGGVGLNVTNITNSNGNEWPPTLANLRLAFLDLADTGGKVSYPGNTEINVSGTPLLIPSNVIFEGCGYNSSLRLADGADIDILTLNGQHDITIRDIRFNVNNYTQGAYINAISMGASQWTYNITIEHCWFEHGNASFIDAEEFTYNIVVDTCFFYEIEDNIYNRVATYNASRDMYPAGIWFSGYDCTAKNNFIKNTFACGIVMEAGTTDPTSRGHLIDGNTITGRVSHGIHMEGKGGQLYYKASTTRIVNNRIYDCNSTAYESTDPGYGKGILLSENSSAINNYIRNSPDHAIEVDGNNTLLEDNIIDTVQNAHAIRTTGNAYSTQIIGNVINDTDGGNAIHLDGTAGYLAIIDNNQIIDIEEDGITSGVRTLIATGNNFENIGGISIEIASGTLNATISENEFRNNDGTYAIYIPASTESIISTNFFYDMATYGIYVLSDDNIISNNKLTNGGQDAIHMHECENNTLLGNHVKHYAGDGIELNNCKNTSLGLNHVYDCTDGIDETGTCSTNAYVGNIALGNSGNNFSLGGEGDESAANIGD